MTRRAPDALSGRMARSPSSSNWLGRFAPTRGCSRSLRASLAARGSNVPRLILELSPRGNSRRDPLRRGDPVQSIGHSVQVRSTADLYDRGLLPHGKFNETFVANRTRRDPLKVARFGAAEAGQGVGNGGRPSCRCKPEGGSTSAAKPQLEFCSQGAADEMPSLIDKTALFIDGAHLYATSRALGFDIDFSRLLKEFRSRGNLVRAIASGFRRLTWR
jgi:hypothetical protein